MGWFGKRKKDDVLDLTGPLLRRQQRIKEMREDLAKSKSSEDNPVSSGLGFLGQIAGTASESSSSDSGYADMSSDASEKRRRLTKRIMDMTEKIEELSNQIYHLQQRVEVLERKSGVGGGY